MGLGGIDRKGAARDVAAGLTLAALAIPEVMGYTKISGTPVITGLYTMLLPSVLFALFGSSRRLVVGADSATAAILASSLAAFAAPLSPQWLSLAGVLALMTAGMLFLARAARFAFLADFLSRTVLIGFLTGVGIQVALGELGGMLGIEAGGSGTVGKAVAVLSRLGTANVPGTAVAAAVVVLVPILRRVSRKIPGALIAVSGAAFVSWAFALDHVGVRLLGTIPRGLPRIVMPALPADPATLGKLVPTAFALFIVILAQSAATARAYAAKYDESFDQNKDLVGLGLANLAAGLTGTFVVNGSPTKTQMVDSAGGRSQLAQLTSSAAVLLTLLFLTGPLAYLPMSALSAIVFLIGVELVDVRSMRRVYRERPWEFWVALFTAAAVVVAGVEWSILLAIFLSLAVHTRHGYLVNNRLLVPDQGDGMRQRPVSSGAQYADGLVVYRFMHNLYYANAQSLLLEILGLCRREPKPAWICVDAAAMNDVDFTAAETLRALHRHASALGVRLAFCEVVEEVRAEFDRSGLTGLFGADAFYPSIEAVVREFETRERL